jgi:DNA-binding winged helix-turn-helix (wHTH) protein
VYLGQSLVPSVSFPPFRLDLDDERLWKGTKAVAIRRKPFAILRYLVAHPRRLVTHEELLKEIWGGSVVSESAVRSHLHELRQALGDGVIETVIGRGYRFAATLEAVSVYGTAPPAISPRLIVGRAAELALLRAAFDRAHGGHRQVCFVTGEPGIGKTTLVDAFLDELAARADVSALRGQCVEQHGTPEAYLPMLQIAGALGPPALAVLLRRAPAFIAQLPHLVPEAQRADLNARAAGGNEARMVRELIDALDEIGTNHTLVLVLEDLQWSDLATLDLLAVLAQRRERARLLVIATTRRAEAQTVDHPLNRVMRPLVTRGGAIAIPLERIAATSIGELLALRFPDHTFPPELGTLLDQITEGTPLFVASMLDDLVSRGMLAEREGVWALTVSPDQVAAHRPESVRQMIDIQLDRLTREEQHTLEAASLVGIELSIGPVAAALELPLETVDELADDLARRSLFLRAIPAGYAFTHGLVQEVCRDRSAAIRRERWHRNIATHLEATRTTDIALRLAAHFEHGNLPARGVHSYVQAAEQALRRYASEDAMSLFAHAERLLPRITDERERDTHELALLDSLAPLAMRVHRELARDPIATLQRRIVLTRRLGDPTRVCLALLDLALLRSVHAQHGDVVALLADIDALLATAEVIPAIHGYADSVRAMSLFWHGRIREAHALFERVFATPVSEHGPRLVMESLLDRKAMLLGYLSGIYWMIGEPDRAVREVQQACDLAAARNDPYEIGIASSMLAWLHIARRDPPETVRALAERLLARPDCAMWHAASALLVAWVKSRTAPLSDDEADVVDASFRAQLAASPLAGSLLATRVLGALEGSSRLAATCTLVERLFGTPSSHDERPFTPDLLRQLGDIAPDPGAAAVHYLASLSCARDNGAASYELRAANELARLWSGTPREAEARAHVATALAQLVDGVDTRDQRDARTFLATP